MTRLEGLIRARVLLQAWNTKHYGYDSTPAIVAAFSRLNVAIWDLTPCNNCENIPDECDCATCEECGTPVDSTCNVCNECDSCCSCFVCRACHQSRAEDLQCGTCEYCTTRCCECAVCDSCGDRVSNVCDNGHCDGCCDNCNDNGNDNGLPTFAGSGKFHADKRGGIGPIRYVSAEIEFASTSDDYVSAACRAWGAAIVTDGSLPDGGREINTAPAKGAAWHRQVNEICAGLKQSGAKVTASCGLHVHVDARDYTYYDVRRLILVYARIESALFALVSPSRQNNTYCLPCGDKYRQAVTEATGHGLKRGIFQAVYSADPSKVLNKCELKHEKYNSARYSALNLHSWIYRGTIEYRLHHGTVDARKIRMWGELWSRIVEYASVASNKTIDSLPEPTNASDAYVLLRDTVCAGLPDLQAYTDERAARFGVIQLTQGVK